MRVRLAVAVFLFAMAGSAQSQTRTFLVSCQDGDTSTFAHWETAVRFENIDTPELNSDCSFADRDAKEALLERLHEAETIWVDTTGTGRYGRLTARVYADTVDMGMWMRLRGHAVEYPKETCPTGGAVGGGGTDKPKPKPAAGLPYDPHGPDRDCSDFDRQPVTQRFFEAAGGPQQDPHRLDGDDDGVACESLPGGTE